MYSSAPSYKVYDAGHLRPAGIGGKDGQHVSSCLKWDGQDNERPETPDKLKKYRQSRLHEPGTIFRHFSVYDDPVDTQKVYGRSTNKDETLEKVFRAYPESDMMRWTLDRSEDVYYSNQREPLGKGWVRGHKIPQHLGTEVPFGECVNAKANNTFSLARQAIAPVDLEPEWIQKQAQRSVTNPVLCGGRLFKPPLSKEKKGQFRYVTVPLQWKPTVADEVGTPAHDLYVRTHGAYAPGEQRKRDYNWDNTGIDSNAHRFGAVDKSGVLNGVQKCLNPDSDLSTPPATHIVNKVVEDARTVGGEYLGTVKRLGAGDRNISKDFCFGKPSLKAGGAAKECVADLMHGAHSAQEQLPDADLGKSLREGFRNIPPPGNDPNRAYGVPSVRTDLHLRKRTSLANAQNYGNEPDAMALLSPCSTADRGVNEDTYAVKRDRGDIRRLLDSAGISLQEKEFDEVFQAAVAQEAGDGCASLMAFMNSRHERLQQEAGI